MTAFWINSQPKARRGPKIKAVEEALIRCRDIPGLKSEKGEGGLYPTDKALR